MGSLPSYQFHLCMNYSNDFLSLQNFIILKYQFHSKWLFFLKYFKICWFKEVFAAFANHCKWRSFELLKCQLYFFHCVRFGWFSYSVSKEIYLSQFRYFYLCDYEKSFNGDLKYSPLNWILIHTGLNSWIEMRQ